MAETKNKLQSEIRDSAGILDVDVLNSLQPGSPSYCETYLAERIMHFQNKDHISLETSRHVENLRGLEAILQVLMTNVDLPGKTQKTVRLSYMNFDEAFALFLSFNSVAIPSMLRDRGQRKRFINLIYHPNHGIPVYVVKRKYLLLKSNDVDLDIFLEEYISVEESQAHNTDSLMPGEIDDIIESLDTV